ncbi:M1-specific T cell receptor alpha chain-like isoform X2 [Mustelus asterias]
MLPLLWYWPALRFNTESQQGQEIIGVNLKGGLCYWAHCCVNTVANELIFGQGTRLTVLPKQNALKPSIYILPPRESDRKASPVCLVTDYFPNNVSMSVSAGGQTSNRSHEGASLSLADRTYSMVGFLSSSQSTQDGVFNCMCDYGSKRLPQDGQIEPQCIEVEEDEEGDEQANLLSLTVFCLRILFLKSIVFNVLMTIRVWVS